MYGQLLQLQYRRGVKDQDRAYNERESVCCRVCDAEDSVNRRRACVTSLWASCSLYAHHRSSRPSLRSLRS